MNNYLKNILKTTKVKRNENCSQFDLGSKGVVPKIVDVSESRSHEPSLISVLDHTRWKELHKYLV